jgi:hypothetical protein
MIDKPRHSVRRASMAAGSGFFSAVNGNQIDNRRNSTRGGSFAGGSRGIGGFGQGRSNTITDRPHFEESSAD